jgi:hypothetical protein
MSSKPQAIKKICDTGELVSLTSIYKQAVERGLADGKRDPRRWSKEEGAQFIDFIAENLHVRKSDIYKASKARIDRGGGTYAHPQIALAYAKYLSPELHSQVNETFLRAKSGDVTLAAEIADKQTDPAKLEWLSKRVAGTAARNKLTSTLKAHGVSGSGYKDCTNAIYQPLMGGTAADVREKRGLPEKANLREHMNTDELVETAYAELLAKRRIEARNSYGNTSCVHDCNEAGRIVANQRFVDMREAA